ncbi:MAG: ABC transporter ATP-binding protein [Thermoanaerobacteraceae bacterium]|nr:ABC transporter ATP-binding protein [Thermoanaerobacteraceae bacterium]
MQENIIKLVGISKVFPGVVANDNINLEIKRGEIHAIVGENGAGKSTLMKIIYGLYQPTAGQIYINDRLLNVSNPQIAIKNGIGMVHQHFMLVPSFTAAENVVLGSEPRKNTVIMDLDEAAKITKTLSEKYGLYVDPYQRVEDLSVGIQQRVEILKVLYKGADILILDEPTAVLTPQETEELFAIMRRLVRELGKTIIIITHKLQEVLEVSDRVSVMRRGKLVGTMDTKDATEQLLAEMMVGKEVVFDKFHTNQSIGKTLIEVKNLVVKDNRDFVAVDGISFSIAAGEILGVAGVEGNGQSELVEALTGLRKVEQGSIFVKGKDMANTLPSKFRKMGISHVPEDRIKTGLAPEASVNDNLMMGYQHKKPYETFGMKLNKKAIFQKAAKLIQQFDIRTPSGQTKVKSLSGGNMQKLVIAREFSFDSQILIISQPTRGLDVGAIEFIHRRIIDMRDAGKAILLVSADLDEIFRLSDRIVTIYEGKLTGQFKAADVTKQEIGLYMTGKNLSTAG